MIEKIIIVGKGGSGKDYLRKMLQSFYGGLKYCKSYTTRPKRKDEVDGFDYYFITENQIPEKKDLYESVTFNGWFYGTTKEDFKNSNLLIMTPKGISSLKKKDRKKSVIVYIQADEETRRRRLSTRKDSDDVERRILADKEDFMNFEDFDITIKNSTESENEIKNFEDLFRFLNNN